MTASDPATDWRLLREFALVDLEQSFILSWEMRSGMLFVDIDLHLLPEHPFYEKPRPAEKVCIRPAVIEFPLCDSIQVDEIVDIDGPQAVVANLGVGRIRGMRRLEDGRYEISGSFGLVHVEADRPILRLKAL